MSLRISRLTVSRWLRTVVVAAMVFGLVPASPAVAAGAGSISGTVRAESGPAISGAGVRLYQLRSGSWVWWDYVTSGADGSYGFSSVPDGAYAIAFDRTGYMSECFDDVATLAGARQLAITGATALVGKDATMTAPGGFSGRVVDGSAAPLQGVRVTPYRRTPDGAWEPNPDAVRVTAADGTWAFTSLLTGTYRLQFSDPLERVATRFVGGASTLDAAADQTCLPGSPAPLGDTTLPPAGLVTGSIEHSYYMGGAFTVTAHQLNGGVWDLIGNAECDSAGQYRLALEPGTYRLRVVDGTGTYASGWLSSSGQIVSRPDEASDVVVSASGTVNTGQNWMGVAGTAYGTVVNGAGDALSGVRAAYEQLIYKPSLGSAEWTLVHETTTGPGGTWQLDDLIQGVSARVTFDPTAYNSANSTDLAHYTWVHPVSGNAGIPFASNSLARMDATLTPEPDNRAPVTSAALDPNPWRWSSVPVTVTLSADDPPGANGVTRGVRETRWSTRQDAGTISAETIYGGPVRIDHPGMTAFYYRSIDNAGNEESPFDPDRMKAVSIYYDPNPPETTPHYSATNTNSALIVIGFSDPLSGWGDVKTKLDDGPWVSGQLVSTNLPGDHTLYYYGIDAVGNDEMAKSITFNVGVSGGDTTPPVTTISDPATVNGWIPSPSSDEATMTALTLDAVDGPTGSGVAQRYFTVDGGGTQTYNTTDLIRLTQGEHTVAYWSTDVAGNTEAVQTKTVRFDGTYPTLSVAIPDLPKDSAAVTITASDPYSGAAKIYYRLDTGNLTAVDASQVVVPVSGYGTHALTYFAGDAAGNGNPAFGPFSYLEFSIGYSDSVAPQSTISGVPGGWTNSAVELSLTATDAAGLGEVVSGVTTKKINAYGYMQDYAAPISISAYGTTTVEYCAVDAAGNREETRTAFVRIDYEPPSTYGDAVVLPYAGTFVYPITATDGLSGVAATYWRIDGGPWHEGALAVCSEPGLHNLECYSVDRAGNSNQAYVPSTGFQVLWPDVTAPVVNQNFNAPDGTNGWTWYDINGSLDARDPDVADHATSGIAELAWRVGASAEQTSTGYGGVYVADEGTTTVTYRATDKAGRETTGSVTVKLDKHVPTVSEGTVTFGDGYSEISLQASDTVSGVESVYWRYGANFQSLGTTMTGSLVRITQAGNWYVEYWAVDRAGLSSGPSGRSLTVTGSGGGGTDIVAPFTSTSGVPSGWSKATSATVGLSAIDYGTPLSGVASIRYRIDGGGESIYSTPIKVTKEGTTTINYWAVDNQNNTETPRDAVVRLDRTKPTVSSDAKTAYEGSALVAFQAADALSGVARVWYSIDSGSWQQGMSASVTGVSSHTIEFYSEDRAGNVSASQRATFDITAAPVVDNMPPVTSVTGVPSGWVNTNVLLTFNAVDYAPAGALAVGVAGTRAAVLPAAEADVAGSLVVSGEGTRTVVYRSGDAADNWEPPNQVQVFIDRTAPVTGHDAAATYIDSATITLRPVDTLSGVAGTLWKLDDGAWMAGTVVTCTSLGSHTLWISSTDAAGNVETQMPLTFAVLRPAAVTLKTSSSAPAYNYNVTLTATVTDTAGPVVGARVLFERQSGTSWVSAGATGTTGVTGAATLPVKPFAYSRSVYRARVLPDATHVPAAEASGLIAVKPKAYVGLPTLTVTSPVHARSFTTWGLLKPKHKRGDKSVVLRFYRRSGTVWYLKKTISAVNYDYSGNTKYLVTTSLPTAGSWKVVASHGDAAHTTATSSARLFMVK